MLNGYINKKLKNLMNLLLVTIYHKFLTTNPSTQVYASPKKLSYPPEHFHQGN
jgi:hypothetical protein